MLGNLSKLLFKAPRFLENKRECKTIDFLDEIREENISTSLNYKSSNNNKSFYFKEKDFWKNNFEPQINFNRNKRLSSYGNLTPNRRQYLKKNHINLFKSSKYKIITIKENRTYTLTDSPINNRNNLSNNYSIYNKNTIGSDVRLKTDSNINKVKNKNKFLNINLFPLISINKRYDKENTKKFPQIYNSFKSRETLFQDKADNKLKSLISIKPEIKEQLKEKNRLMVGQKDFLRYLNFRKWFPYDPFYESIKVKDEINNNY